VEKGGRQSPVSTLSKVSASSSSDAPRSLVPCVTLPSVASQKNVRRHASAQLTNMSWHGFGEELQKLVGREEVLKHCRHNTVTCSGQIHQVPILLSPSDVTLGFL